MADGDWAVRAAIICDGFERGDNGTVIGLRGITDVRLVTEDKPPFLVRGALHVAAIALRDAEPFEMTVTVLAPDGGSLTSDGRRYPATAAGGGVEMVSELTLGLPSLGRYWLVVALDGDELTRVPLHLALWVTPSAGTVH